MGPWLEGFQVAPSSPFGTVSQFCIPSSHHNHHARQQSLGSCFFPCFLSFYALHHFNFLLLLSRLTFSSRCSNLITSSATHARNPHPLYLWYLDRSKFVIEAIAVHAHSGDWQSNPRFRHWHVLIKSYSSSDQAHFQPPTTEGHTAHKHTPFRPRYYNKLPPVDDCEPSARVTLLLPPSIPPQHLVALIHHHPSISR